MHHGVGLAHPYVEAEVSAMIPNIRSPIAAPVLIVAAALIAWIAAPPARADVVGLVIQLEKDVFGTPPDAQREKKHPRFPVG